MIYIGGTEILKRQRIEVKLKTRKDMLNQLLIESRIGTPTSNQKQHHP